MANTDTDTIRGDVEDALVHAGRTLLPEGTLGEALTPAIHSALYDALGEVLERFTENGTLASRRDAMAAVTLSGLLTRRELNTPADEKRLVQQARRITDFLIAELDGTPTES